MYININKELILDVYIGENLNLMNVLREIETFDDDCYNYYLINYYHIY